MSYRRQASSEVNNAGNSQVEQAPNAYEMSRDVTSQSGASAPAESTNTTKPGDDDKTQPARSPGISSLNDTTLIDNDLYE